MRRLAALLFLAGCPALYSPNWPDLASDEPDLAVPDLARMDWCAGCAGTCLIACMPPPDACAGVSCPAGESCLDGVCLAGCVLDRCAGKTCAAGQRCWQGQCVRFAECDLFSCPDTICGVLCLPVPEVFGCERDAGSCECGCLESCAGGRCVPTCSAPNVACGCDCCPPTLSCGSDGHCHGMIN